MAHSLRAARRTGTALVLAGCLALANCEDISNAYYGKTISMSGAGVALDQPFKPYSEGQLTDLIASSVGKDRPLDTSTLSRVIGSFAASLYRGGPPDTNTQNAMRDARNQIQGALLAESANRCDAFKLLLRERSTNTNFVLGSLATGLGAAGAIVSGGASQALAGAAAAASGVGAEYNKDIMSSVTSSVIIPGIDKERSAILQEISNRRCLGLSSYNLTQAMTDAIRYHSACSTDVGVAAAGSALSQTNSMSVAGLVQAQAALGAIEAMRANDQSAGRGTPASSKRATGKPGKEAWDGGAAPAATGSDSTSAAPATGPALLGDQISFLQCPSLDKDGTLPKDAGPDGSKTAVSGQFQYGIR
jgi:hypothetical protein